jgi:hypothetical protein
MLMESTAAEDARTGTSPPPGEPYHGFAEDLANRNKRSAEAAEAAAAVLPGPLKKAFGEWAKVLPGGFTLQPVTAGLLTVLVRIQSPLLEVVKAYSLGKSQEEAEAALKKLNPDPEAMVETVFCFVTPAPRLRAMVAKGRQAFREVAMTEVGDKLHPAEMAALELAVARHYAESFLTAIQYEAAMPEGGGGTVF